jgi:hypothetical protein
MIIHIPPCGSNAPAYAGINYVVDCHVTIQLKDLKDMIRPCCLFTLLFIDIGKNRRTQQKLFIISYTILLFVIQCN